MNAAPYGVAITICLIGIVLFAGALLLVIFRPGPDEHDEHEFEQSDDVFTGWDDDEGRAA